MPQTHRTRRRILTHVGSVTSLALAGCTGLSDRGQTSTDTPADRATDTARSHADAHEGSLDGPQTSVSVAMTTTNDGAHFKPHIVWVEQGGSVTWEVESGTHTTTAYAKKTDNPQRIPDAARAWDSGTLSTQGKTFEHPFETPGVYDYLCTPHEATGMVGTVIVGTPETQGQPALQPPQEGLPAAAAQKLESLTQRITEALGNRNGHNGTATHGGTEAEQ